jgi:uncharacterized membrane protein
VLDGVLLAMMALLTAYAVLLEATGVLDLERSRVDPLVVVGFYTSFLVAYGVVIGRVWGRWSDWRDAARLGQPTTESG